MEFDSFVLAASVADLDAERRAREHADAVEFRMDRAADPLAAIDAYDGALPVIATNRTTEEGGDAPPGEARRDLLRAAAGRPLVAAIDVELATARTPEGERLVADARSAGATVIASVHDFAATPPPERLRDLLAAAADRGDVGKLAVTARDVGDVLDLLAVTHEFATAGERVATMAMGGPGRHSRAVAPLYGSRIGYAPVDPDRATAPGQYDLATLADLVERLGDPGVDG